MFLIVCGVGFLAWNHSKSDANVLVGTSCRDVKIGPAQAFCFSVATCVGWPVDSQTYVFVWMSNNTTCPNFYPPVLNSVAADAGYGDPGIVGTARSVTVPLARIVALGFSFSWCNGMQGSAVDYFMQNCQAYVPPPDICFLPECYDGGGGGGGGGWDPYGGGGEGCTYCSENWMWDAQCHDAFDTVCPLLFQ